jgi:hypothetical protein
MIDEINGAVSAVDPQFITPAIGRNNPAASAMHSLHSSILPIQILSIRMLVAADSLSGFAGS